VAAADDRRAAALRRLEVLVGEWTMEAEFPRTPPTGPVGRVVFDWILHGQFLAQRSEAPEPAPDSLAVIGFDPDSGGYSQVYFDARGVARVYQMTLGPGSWSLLRAAPDFSPLDFSQRFTGTFGDENRVIRGAWEMSEDGTTWRHDFDLTYRRVGRPTTR
jgi:hypothetical protein